MKNSSTFFSLLPDSKSTSFSKNSSEFMSNCELEHLTASKPVTVIGSNFQVSYISSSKANSSLSITSTAELYKAINKILGSD